MIFGTKVHDYKPLNVTEPDFQKKRFWANLGQKTAKNGGNPHKINAVARFPDQLCFSTHKMCFSTHTIPSMVQSFPQPVSTENDNK